MEIAKLYGVWCGDYYRTESGKTFCIKKFYEGETIFYYGNVLKGEKIHRIATKEDLTDIKFEK